LKPDEIKSLFASFSNQKVMVIGDVMLDTYIWGKVDRISPEAPVPVVTCNKKEHRLGGAGNVAVNLLALGAKPLLCSIIGEDESGFSLKEIFKQLKLDDKGLITTTTRPTTVKTRVISSDQQMLRVDEETDKPISEKLENEFISHFNWLLESETYDAIIFQDYDKGLITEKVIAEVTKTAKSKKIPILVDPKKRNFFRYTDVDLFKPNFKEFCDGLKIELHKDDPAMIFKAVKDFQNTQNIDCVIITLSDRGIFICDSINCWTLPAHEVDIADVSGAGDTVISVASLCLANKLTPLETAALSNLAGGLVCEKVGVVPIDKKQLEEESLKLKWTN
jgi:D-glycero-beta-D-manno-heptose-7-phosphate kinase